MTEPDEDLTELSSRKRSAEDETRLSARAVGAADDAAAPEDSELSEIDDQTVLSARNSVSPEAVAEPEDATELSSRRAALPDVDEDDGTRFSPRAPVSDVVSEDDTRISRRPGSSSAPPRSRTSGPTLSPLPPGVIGGAAAERGAFGLPPTEYEARDFPEAATEPHAAPAAVPIPAATAPDAQRVRARREAARHRKLITTVIVVAVTAALMTAAVIAIAALINRTT